MFGASLAVLADSSSSDGKLLIAWPVLSCIVFALCCAIVRSLGPTSVKAGFRGLALTKVNKVELPECMGSVCSPATCSLSLSLYLSHFTRSSSLPRATAAALKPEHANEGPFFYHGPYVDTIDLLVGIGDDLFDAGWRHKWCIPYRATLVFYFRDFM